MNRFVQPHFPYKNVWHGSQIFNFISFKFSDTSAFPISVLSHIMWQELQNVTSQILLETKKIEGNFNMSKNWRNFYLENDLFYTTVLAITPLISDGIKYSKKNPILKPVNLVLLKGKTFQETQ